MEQPELERPEESTTADITLITHGVTITAAVESSSSTRVVVRPTGDPSLWRGAVEKDAPVELYWVGGYDELILRAVVVGIEAVEGENPRWSLSVNGPAERSQRRKAVRARVCVPVQIPWAGAQMTGTTIDLSEAGMRAQMDGWGVPLDPGTASQVTLALDDHLLHLHGSIVWNSIRGAQWVLAMQFYEVPEKAADLLRRRVFQVLREERAGIAS